MCNLLLQKYGASKLECTTLCPELCPYLFSFYYWVFKEFQRDTSLRQSATKVCGVWKLKGQRNSDINIIAKPKSQREAS